jgi:hypothetical protein
MNWKGYFDKLESCYAIEWFSWEGLLEGVIVVSSSFFFSFEEAERL